MNHFLDLSDLPSERLEAVLKLAAELERSPRSDALKGRTVGLVFVNPSLRTLASMQAGVSQLGGDFFLIQPGTGSWKLEMRDGAVMDADAAEHVKEGIPVLAEYADALAIRCFAEGKDLKTDLEDRVMRKMAELCPKKFINLESAAAHPCQALADWKTLEDLKIPRQKGKFVLSWAYHPKPLPYAVPSSALNMAVMRGMDVTILRPEGYALPDEVMNRARTLASNSGASIKETSDRREAMEGAHVVYVKSWSAPQFYGDQAKELELRKPYKSWCVAESWFENARKDARLMHCLPVRRNAKVADEVLDGPRSVVVREAANRLHAQKALMVEMLGR